MQKKINRALYIIVSVLIAVNIVLIPTKSEEEQYAKVPILLYHNIIQNVEGENVLVNISPDNFRAHLTAIKDAGYECINYNDYYEYVYNDKILPQKPIIITFDDGYLSNYEYAYPILSELNMKATIFIITSTVGATESVSNPHFTWNQAKEMEDSGVIDIESHTHTHMEIPTLDVNSIVREIRLSKYLIEKNMGKQCDYLAYPFGMYNEKSLSIASAAGYKMQSRLGNSGYNTKSTPPELIRRITVWGNRSADELLSTIEENLQLNDSQLE